jgi:hypothetical protein
VVAGGTSTAVIVCHRCGHENPDDTTHCLGCRAYLAWLGRASATDAADPVRDEGAGMTDLDGETAPTVPTPAVADPEPPTDAGWIDEQPDVATTRTGPEAGVPIARPAQSARPQPIVNRTRHTAPVEPRKPPQWTIGVSVGETPTRVHGRGDTGGQPRTSFEAVNPEDPPTQRPSSSVAPPRRPFSTLDTPGGTVTCRVCGTVLPAERRFCRCGATLVEPPRQPLAASRPRLPWYRRLRGPGSAAEFRQAMKSANGGYRLVYNGALSVRALLFRTTMFLGAMGIGFSLVGPWSPDIRGQLHEWADQVIERVQGGEG